MSCSAEQISLKLETVSSFNHPLSVGISNLTLLARGCWRHIVMAKYTCSLYAAPRISLKSKLCRNAETALLTRFEKHISTVVKVRDIYIVIKKKIFILFCIFIHI